MELTKQKLILALAAAVVGTGLALYLFLYFPLLKQIKAKGSECRALETEVTKARATIAGLGKVGPGKEFIDESEVSSAIDELTKQGKSLGVNFISMTPGQTEKLEDSKFRVLPIEIETESSFEALGRFLGSVEKIEKGLANVGNFYLSPDPKNASKLKLKLAIQLYER